MTDAEILDLSAGDLLRFEYQITPGEKKGQTCLVLDIPGPILESQVARKTVAITLLDEDRRPQTIEISLYFLTLPSWSILLKGKIQ